MTRADRKYGLPWAAWHGDGEHEIDFPAAWPVQVCSMRDAPVLDSEQLRAAFDTPIGCAPLPEIFRGKKRIAIAVDDLSRPTPTAQILPLVLQALHRAGLEPAQISIIISLGAHTRLGQEQLVRKLGAEVVGRYRIVNHDARAELPESGVTVGRTAVRLNETFLQADGRILIGSVVPHHFAGFSGGAKMVLPGLANLEAIGWTHKAVLMGLRGKPGTIHENRFRREIERVAAAVGVDVSINAVVNSARQIAGLFVGDLVAAHRRAAAFAQRVYETAAPASLNVAVLNCYPKDTELIQAENAFMVLHSAGVDAVREGGTIVVTSACSEGMGRHGLFEPGGLLYRRPARKAFLGNRHLVFYSPHITRQAFHQLYWDEYDFFADWNEVLACLRARHGAPTVRDPIGIFPQASVQLAKAGV